MPIHRLFLYLTCLILVHHPCSAAHTTKMQELIAKHELIEPAASTMDNQACNQFVGERFGPQDANTNNGSFENMSLEFKRVMVSYLMCGDQILKDFPEMKHLSWIDVAAQACTNDQLASSCQKLLEKKRATHTYALTYAEHNNLCAGMVDCLKQEIAETSACLKELAELRDPTHITRQKVLVRQEFGNIKSRNKKIVLVGGRQYMVLWWFE